uniref:Uncharacterized protein n=1 Tax=Tanacetum cinerariifolium TaxID=118510 RepID=A0A699HL85_TANCI|nr:hypothetical protein [Tanacetum cinerariifolium]
MVQCQKRHEKILKLQTLMGSNVVAESVRLAYGLSLDVDDPVDMALAYREKMSKLKSHEKLKMDVASMTFDEVVAWEKEESISPLLRTPPLKPRKIGIEFPVKNMYVNFLHADCVDDHFDPFDFWKYKDVYGGGYFDVGGSFKGFDWIDEPVGSDGRSLPGKSKYEFLNDVILDDVVSSPATTFSLLLNMKGKSRVKFTRMRAIIKRSKMLSLRKSIRSNYGKLVTVIGLNEDVGNDDLKDTDDVVSSPSTAMIGLNEVVGDDDLKDIELSQMTALWVETASMNNDSRVEVSSLGGLGTQFHRQRQWYITTRSIVSLRTTPSTLIIFRLSPYDEVRLETDDETSSNDDTYSNDDKSLNYDTSSSEILINYLSTRDIQWQIPKNTQAKQPKPLYVPIKTKKAEPLPLHIMYPHSHFTSSTWGTNTRGKAHYWLISLGPPKEKIVHVKKPYSMMKVTNAVLGFRTQKAGVTRFPVLPLMKCIWKKKKWSLKFIPKAILNMILLGLKLLHTDNDVYFFFDVAEEDDAGLRCCSSTPFDTRFKRKISKRKKIGVIHDEGAGIKREKSLVNEGNKGKEKVFENEGSYKKRKKTLVTGGSKGKEKVFEDECMCSNRNKSVVTIYKRGMVNDKAKMVEVVGAVKTRRDRGVVIGGKEEVVSKRLEVEKCMEQV